MSHIGCKDDDWANANVSHSPPEDLFECKRCKIEFGIESSKVVNNTVFCPLCVSELKAWRKNWEAPRY